MIALTIIVIVGTILNISLIKLYKLQYKYLMYLLAIPFFFAGYIYLLLFLLDKLFNNIIED